MDNLRKEERKTFHVTIIITVQRQWKKREKRKNLSTWSTVAHIPNLWILLYTSFQHCHNCCMANESTSSSAGSETICQLTHWSLDRGKLFLTNVSLLQSELNHCHSQQRKLIFGLVNQGVQQKYQFQDLLENSTDYVNKNLQSCTLEK